MLGWWQLMGGAPPDRGAVSDALGSIAAHGGLSGLVTCLAHGPVDGWSALAEAMASSQGVQIRLGTAVSRVEQTGDGVTCTTDSGERLTARAAVIAVPLNCLPVIEFTPPLPPPARDAAGANAGAAVKLLMLARGVPPQGIAVGIGPGLNWLYADREIDGETLVIGFGWDDPEFDPADRGHVRRALGAFYPEGELVDWRQHDWIRDPRLARHLADRARRPRRAGRSGPLQAQPDAWCSPARTWPSRRPAGSRARCEAAPGRPLTWPPDASRQAATTGRWPPVIVSANSR